MRILFIASLALLFSTFTYAGTGQARLSHYYGNGSTYLETYLYISNITSNTVNVSVTFYDQNGAVLDNGLTYSNFSNNNTQLPPHGAGHIRIFPPTEAYGHAVVSWSNVGTDDNAQALIAHATRITRNGSTWRSDVAILVNGGQPF